jgi:hypothetical protein
MTDDETAALGVLGADHSDTTLGITEQGLRAEVLIGAGGRLWDRDASLLDDLGLAGNQGRRSQQGQYQNGRRTPP